MFYNNKRAFFAIFSGVSRKAFAFTTNTDAVILTWIAVTLIGYNWQKAALLRAEKGYLIRSLPQMCIRHSTYIKWKSGHRSILIPLLVVSRLRTTAYAYKLFFLFNAKVFWIMLSLFFFSFFASSRNRRLQHALEMVVFFSIYLFYC